MCTTGTLASGKRPWNAEAVGIRTSHGGKGAAGVWRVAMDRNLDSTPEGRGESIIDAEQLLVCRGWQCLRREIHGSTLQVALCLGRREDADRLHLTRREFQVCGLAARGLGRSTLPPSCRSLRLLRGPR